MHIWPTFYNVTLVIDDDWIPAPSEMKCFLNVLIVQLLTHGADSEFQLSTTLLLKQLKVAMHRRISWHNRFKKLCPEKFGGAIRVLAMPPKNIYSLPNFVSFFCYAPKRPSPFF